MTQNWHSSCFHLNQFSQQISQMKTVLFIYRCNLFLPLCGRKTSEGDVRYRAENPSKRLRLRSYQVISFNLSIGAARKRQMKLRDWYDHADDGDDNYVLDWVCKSTEQCVFLGSFFKCSKCSCLFNVCLFILLRNLWTTFIINIKQQQSWALWSSRNIRRERSSCVLWYSPSSSLISLNCRVHVPLWTFL